MNTKTEFNSYRKEIRDVLNKRGDTLHLGEKADLVSGFLNLSLENEVTKGFSIGCSVFPMVVVVGRESGRLYFFALKNLLPDLKL